MSRRHDRLRSRFLLDQRAGVIDFFGEAFADYVGRGHGQSGDNGHPIVGGFEERLRLWVDARICTVCAHLDPDNAPAPAFWLARRGNLIRCASCLVAVLDVPPGQQLCDACSRPDTGFSALWTLTLIGSTPVLLMADLCSNCATATTPEAASGAPA